MSTTATNNVPAGRVLHWIACLLGTAIVLLFIVFAVGEGAPVALLLRPQTMALLVMLVGFLLTWRYDLVGGVLSLGGITAFYVFEYFAAGNLPGGWGFPLCFLPGVLAIMAGTMQSRRNVGR